MKPITLTMCAFGSFPNTETIHFERFGEAPLFLINGPTGSGKTTILDAMCFALYGETTGEEREARQMRCDFSEPSALTEVSLEFELAQQRYRIRRVPEQQRPKAKGDGTTTQAPEAQLWCIDGDGVEQVIVSKKVKDATAEITQLTGLSVNQFRQVMVLPQGKFRELLLADSKDREKIFSQLFQTGMYKQLEDKLKQKANAIAADVSQQRQLQQGVLEGVGVSDIDALQVEIQDASHGLLTKGKEKDHHKKVVTDAEATLQKQRMLLEAFERKDATQQDLDGLEQQIEAINVTKSRVASSEGALLIQPLYIEKQRVHETHLALLKDVETIKQEEAMAAREFLGLDEKRRALEKKALEVDTLKADIHYLSGLRERLDVFNAAKESQRVEKDKWLSSQQRYKEAAERLRVVEAEKATLLTQLTTLQQVIVAGEGCLLEQEEARRVHDQKTQYDALKADIVSRESQREELKSSGLAAKQTYEDAVKSTQHATLTWHQGQAAILAASLNEGEPCLVCGSVEHPMPAHQSNDNIPSKDDLERLRGIELQANQMLMQAREHYAQCVSSLTHVKDQLHLLEQGLGEHAVQPLEQAKAYLATASAKVHQWEKDKQQRDHIQARIEKADAAVETSTKACEIAREQEASIGVTCAAIDAQCDQAAQEIPEEFRHPGVLKNTLTTKQSALDSLQTTMEGTRKRWETVSATLHGLRSQLKEREIHCKRSQCSVEEANDRWKVALENSMFSSEAEFSASRESEEEIRLLKRSVTDFDTRLAQARGALQEQTHYLADKTRPMMAPLQAQVEESRRAFIVVEDAWRALDKRVSALSSAQKTLQTMQENMTQLEADYGVIGTLSDVASGQKYEKISLQRFVLGVLLDDVLVEASQRLQLMSKGRYLLLRKSEKAKGNKASGLELVVDDAYTGIQRPVATLSGGESFMAALSLALGLSDVVQAHSGGVRLDMLFIDEGFGSLDPESLELAIRTLLDLQEAGRMVGVISHVSDLKEQISLRLDVVASHRGSRTQLAGVVA